MSEKLKVVVIDDNDARKKQIQNCLPPYMDVFFLSSTEAARKVIRPDLSGRRTDLIILNAEDAKGLGRNLFDWLKNEGVSDRIDRIPVILLVQDAFSDHALSFLELGDADFYEGAIDPDRFYLLATRAINQAEMAPEPKTEPVSYTEKKPDRVVGCALRPVGEDATVVRRRIALQSESQQAQLGMALQRIRVKRELMRELIRSQGQEKKPQERPPLHRMNPQVVSQLLQGAGQSEMRTIAVVDSDRNTLQICEDTLKQNYRVVPLSTGMNAIGYFVRDTADLLLISFQMPQAEGVKILDSIRWQPNGKRVPAVLMVEGELAESQQGSGKDAVIGMLRKPLQQQELRQVVERILSESKE